MALITYLIIVGLISAIGLIIACNTNSEEAGAVLLITTVLCFAVCFNYAINHSTLDDWYNRELQSETVIMPSPVADELKSEYKDSRLWAVMDRNSWEIYRGYTYKEAEEKRKDLLGMAGHQSRLFIEVDNLKN